jgi:hypothetical protein
VLPECPSITLPYLIQHRYPYFEPKKPSQSSESQKKKKKKKKNQKKTGGKKFENGMDDKKPGYLHDTCQWCMCGYIS